MRKKKGVAVDVALVSGTGSEKNVEDEIYLLQFWTIRNLVSFWTRK